MIYWLLFVLLVVLLILFVYLPIGIERYKYRQYKKNQVIITDYHNNDEEDGLPRGVL